MHHFDPGHVPARCDAPCQAVIARSPFSGLNFLFSDGERLYAYRLGIFELHWLRAARPAARGLASA